MKKIFLTFFVFIGISSAEAKIDGRVYNKTYAKASGCPLVPFKRKALLGKEEGENSSFSAKNILEAIFMHSDEPENYRGHKEFRMFREYMGPNVDQLKSSWFISKGAYDKVEEVFWEYRAQKRDLKSPKKARKRIFKKVEFEAEFKNQDLIGPISGEATHCHYTFTGPLFDHPFVDTLEWTFTFIRGDVLLGMIREGEKRKMTAEIIQKYR